MTTTPWAAHPLLTDDLLGRFRSRAAEYDAANIFFTEDFDELQAGSYLRMLVECPPGDAGGMARAAASQRRLASAAPATALGSSMHLVWTAVAGLLAQRGDPSLGFVLDEAERGEVFAFGVSEPGNDAVLFDSLTRVEQIPGGGYSYTGTKVFTSLSPVWTRLGIFGKLQADDGADDAILHAFVPRGTAGVETLTDWNPHGMRATQSNTTRLTDVRVPPDAVFRSLPVGPNRDLLVFGIFAAFETLIASVYLGIADRALELAAEALLRRRSHTAGRPLADDPVLRNRLAAAAMRRTGAEAELSGVVRDLDGGIEAGSAWFPRLVTLKTHAVEAAVEATNIALHVGGGSGFSASSEAVRLSRDALAGQFHPSTEESARASVATSLLGAPSS
ncbi:acyl-CoA dehydrogenase [Arthrobacter agilis]|uniref:acyl-CoA dehydrogenase family protein n=1 Tax=Arthrobacter agilis TaxID=37921 RepID=UPI000B361A24|nr:acyl-CoA dehydrogenase family protein [Arthrobacter agilis]OUM44487.1 acyl-CoA dehydrogenase [Arthrobacter agilis]PPB47390.1 acyl-CoA dehydrogenase [Arthrobacter agilis]TPV22820.1 acyl-CoA dehydrogenase [Arthrobacter agilis]VDR32070.1 Flavin-dependent monooxygenase, oxygenase subunit HsaA [Arthrobacter agilis]